MAEATEAQVRMIFIKGRGKNSRVLICYLTFYGFIFIKN